MMPKTFSLILLMCSSSVVSENGTPFMPRRMHAGPWVKQTEGQVWPKPQYRSDSNTVLSIEPRTFHFQLSERASRCSTLKLSLQRFYDRAFPTIVSVNSSVAKEKSDFHVVHVVLEPPHLCPQWPHPNMNETYEVRVAEKSKDDGVHFIRSSTVWGLLRGLETITQLIHRRNGVYVIGSTHVVDYPRFEYRGFMIDTSRHFLSVSSILQNLDLMEMNKLNVLHWHVTDDQSFPYQSRTFPDLSAKGAYHPDTHVYSPASVSLILESARLRGIRVVPEFDTPGHTQSWELGQPGLLTPCYSQGRFTGHYGPMNPTSDFVYAFLDSFYTEINDVFKDQYLVLGGDEVDTKCWRRNPDVLSAMSRLNVSVSSGQRSLEALFMHKLLRIVDNLPNKRQVMVWQEAFDNRATLSALKASDAIVHVWKNWGPGTWRRELKRVTSSGLRAVLSAPYYLNYIDYGSDWVESFYMSDPLDFEGGSKHLVIGGEACIWAEFVNSVNLISQAWPRASAVAERLWSNQRVRAVNNAARRLQEHECRMLQRGFPVQPVIGSGYCEVQWQ